MRRGKFLLLCAAIAAILSGCWASTPAVVKIGLIAPFEGAYRDTGYGALAGVRLALRAQNERAGSFRVELVALDDHHDRTGQLAAQRAAELVADAAVVAVIGGFGDGPAKGAAPVLAAAGGPVFNGVGVAMQSPRSGGKDIFFADPIHIPVHYEYVYAKDANGARCPPPARTRARCGRDPAAAARPLPSSPT